MQCSVQNQDQLRVAKRDVEPKSKNNADATRTVTNLSHAGATRTVTNLSHAGFLKLIFDWVQQ